MTRRRARSRAWAGARACEQACGRAPRCALARVAVVLVATAACLVVAGRPADGHAVLLRTEPASGATVEGPAPTEVVLSFSERVRFAPGGIRVLDADLRRVDTGNPRAVDDRTIAVGLEGLRPGTYAVAWRIVSADTHTISGAFSFTVGAPPAAEQPGGPAPEEPEPKEEQERRLERALEDLGEAPPSVVVAAAVARALGYVTALVLFGTLLFLATAWRPVSPGGRIDRAMVHTAGRVLRATWVAAVAASLLLLTTQASAEAGDSLGRGFLPSTVAPVLRSPMGQVWTGRMLALAALLLLLLRLRPAAPRPAPAREPARTVGAMAAGAGGWEAPIEEAPIRRGGGRALMGALLAGAVVVTPALWGHATTVDRRALAVAADAAHLLAVSAWVGGLLCLVALVPRVLRDAPDGEGAAILARTVPRFSRLALGCVVVLVATGVFLSVVQVTTWKAMFGSPYGQVLVAKIVGLALALVLAAFNLFRTQRRLQAAGAEPQESAVWARRLRRIVAGEAVITIVVVVLAAVLVSLPPPRASGTAGAVPQQFTADRVPFGTGTLSLSIHPTRAGRPAEIHLQFSQQDGTPDDGFEDVTASLTLVDENLGPFRYEGNHLAPGHHIVQGFTFPARGKWRLELSARQGEFDQFRKTFEFPVG